LTGVCTYGSLKSDINIEAMFMTEEDDQSTANIVWLENTLCWFHRSNIK